MNHPGSHTHYPHCGTTPSTVDFALTNSPVLLEKVYTIDGNLPSDHSAVVYVIEGTPIDTIRNAIPNYKKADWVKYAHVIEQQLHPNSRITSKTDIDAQITMLINAIRKAELESVPLERRKNKRLEVSESTKELIQLRNETKRRWQRCDDPDLKPLIKKLVNAQNK